MKENLKEQLEVSLRRVAMALLAIAAVAAGTVHAGPPSSVIVGPPTDLAALTWQGGDATLLNETNDARIILFIEQNQGAQFAIFDLTEPHHIKSEGSISLGASGSFDLVSPLGNQADLARFRQGQEAAVLDLSRVGAPKLATLHGLTLPGRMSDAHMVTGPTMVASPVLDFAAIDPPLIYELNRLFDVKQVRAQMTRVDTGTTFMLTEDGLYAIKHPAVEWTHQLMEIPRN